MAFFVVLFVQRINLVIQHEKNVDSDWAFEYEKIKVLDIDDKYINHEITNTEAASIIGVSRGTFSRLVKERKCNP